MRVARRSSQPRELIRLSPLQFSLSVSIVVILLAGAGLVGYYYGLKQAIRPIGETDAGSTDGLHEGPESKPENGGITFYSTLTEPRKNVPAVGPTLQMEETSTPVGTKPAAPPVSGSGIRHSVPAKGSLMLQVASYKDRVNARKLLQELSSEGYAGTVVQADLGQRGVWFRVRVGPYTTGKEAEGVLQKLREERKLKGYIVKQ